METTYGSIRGASGKIAYVFEYAGGVFELMGRALKLVVRGKMAGAMERKAIIEQIESIAIRSLSIVVLTAIFSSMVMTVQFAVQLARFGAKEYVGNVVSLSLVRELGPVLTALMVGGRVGAGISAELGSMNVTEQIDALRSMGADPIQKLVVPRILATTLMLPLLTTLANALGVAGAMLTARLDSGVHLSYFYHSILQAVTVQDFVGGLIKTLLFGFVLSAIACYQGLITRGGTQGVGRSTTQTVVITSVVTLISDFVFTKVLLEFGM